MLDESQQTFAQFKYDLLGGKTRAFAIELLNPTEERLRRYSDEGRQFLQKRVVEFGGVAGSIIGSLVIGTAIMLISLYFFMLDGPAMVESFKGLSPLDDEHEQELVGEFGRVSRAVVVATLLSALTQGLLAGIGFYFVGLDSIFLLTLLSAVLAMVPFVGAAAVWIPCSLYLYFFDNNLPAAIGLAIYGAAVISMADNFIKPYILHGETNLHPLLALLSVIGGVAALGPIGILIGPMVVVFLQTLLKILQRELSLMDGAAKAAS
jgi:predicted PurR-regulated permease PerM